MGNAEWRRTSARPAFTAPVATAHAPTPPRPRAPALPLQQAAPAARAPVAAARSRARAVSVSARKAAAAKSQAYVCLDCGWIYDGAQGLFEKLPANYKYERSCRGRADGGGGEGGSRNRGLRTGCLNARMAGVSARVRVAAGARSLNPPRMAARPRGRDRSPPARCPVCNSPKRRFVPKGPAKGGSAKGAAMRRGAEDGKIDEGDKSLLLAAAAGGAALLGALYFFLNSQVA
jgi:rubredoxin